MLKKFCIIFIILFQAIIPLGQEHDQNAIRECFKNYISTITGKNKSEAIKYVDSRTIKYFSNLLNFIKTADSAMVSSLSIIDKLMILTLRQKSTKIEINALDGRGLVLYAMANGLLSESKMGNPSIGAVIIENNSAKGEFIANEKKAPYYYHFYKEEGMWKIDFTALFPVSIDNLKNMAKSSGKNENDYLLSVISSISVRPTGPEIWKPIQ